jgi:hypothetical protein
MHAEVVFALYRPHSGKDGDLRALIAKHVPTLRRLEVITDRPPVLVKSLDGTYVEIFEWRSAESARKAHEHPEVVSIWEAMAQIADFPALENLKEAKGRFQHFEPVNL